MSNEAVHDHTHLDALFDGLNEAVQIAFAKHAGQGKIGLLRTQVENLFDVFLAHLPEGEARQFHTCSCCRTFMNRAGTIVVIADDGTAHSPLWHVEGVDALYHEALEAVANTVEQAPIRSVFLSSDKILGTPESGGFEHFAVQNPNVYVRGAMTDKQAMALSREHYRTLSHGLGEYSPEHVDQAVALLQADALYRSQKVIGPAGFLMDLHAQIKGKPRRMRENLIWRAVALAPAGFCTPRSTMIGTLLDDIKDGLDMSAVAARFKAKMHPLQYQRPQAAPKAGNVAMAEKIVSEMGLEPALHRRWARFDEVEKIWLPDQATRDAIRSTPGGVFGHLQLYGQETKSPPKMDLPAKPITWVRFRETVLPDARKIEMQVPYGRLNFVGTLTAVHPDAPPILQWDHADARNPVSQYVYHGGSEPSTWGLVPGEWIEVNGIMLHPSKWRGEDRHPNHGNVATFILEGCREHGHGRGSLCLFPEILKSDLNPVRATIEAYSNSRKAVEPENGSANGIRVGGETASPPIRVTSIQGTTLVRLNYIIDRWE